MSGAEASNPPAVPDDQASVLDDVADRVRPELVNEMSATRDLAQDDVHLLSRFEAPDFGLAADGAGGVGRAGVNGLLDRQSGRGPEAACRASERKELPAGEGRRLDCPLRREFRPA